MEPAVFIVILVVLLIAAAVGAVLAHRRERERRAALEALAGKLGLRFFPANDASHDNTYSHFEIFRKGHSRAAYNTMGGEHAMAGRPMHVRCGDFRYKVTRSNGKSTTTHTYNFSYLIVHLPWGVPDLRIRTEHLGDKIAGALGFDDIDFESSEFSRAFHVTCQDKRFAYDVIDPRMMEWLLAERPPTLEIERRQICLSDGRLRWEPERFLGMLRLAEEFLSRWPAHVVASLEAREPPRASTRPIGGDA